MYGQNVHIRVEEYLFRLKKSMSHDLFYKQLIYRCEIRHYFKRSFSLALSSLNSYCNAL